MRAVENGQIDATLQDLPAALFYRDRYPTLKLAGPPVGKGDYVIYVRRGDEPLRDALDRGLGRLIESGELRRIYERYGLWNDAQRELSDWTAANVPGVQHDAARAGWRCVWRYRSRLLDAAWMTIVLSVTSMPLAMALGLLIALGRMYGPRPVRRLLAAYVELLRGTPLMLQLFVLFYLLKLPRLGRGDRRAGDQLFGVRGRDLPRGAAGDPGRARWRPRWPWGCRAGWPCAG